MTKYRLATPEEIGCDIATTLASVHAQLLKKGFEPEIAERIAAHVASAASSNSDGWCGDLARPWDAYINPPHTVLRGG